MAQKNFLKVDKTMLVLVVLLAVFGLAVRRLAPVNIMAEYASVTLPIILEKQLFATALGMGVMYAVTVMDYHFFLKLAPAAYLLSMLLSTAVLLFGQEINGSKRWLNLGPLAFQPSEFAKVAVILFLAWQIERTKEVLKR